MTSYGSKEQGNFDFSFKLGSHLLLFSNVLRATYSHFKKNLGMIGIGMVCVRAKYLLDNNTKIKLNKSLFVFSVCLPVYHNVNCLRKALFQFS